jgi:hypothetical protein
VETWTSEIIVLSETGPWTAAQTAAARAAVRQLLRELDRTEPDDAAIDRCLEAGLRFARNYQRPPNSAAWPFTYYIGVEANPEEFDELADKMRRECEASGLLVTVKEYR